MTPREVIGNMVSACRPEAWAKASRQEARDAIDDALAYKVYGIAGPYMEGRPTYEVAYRLIMGEQPKSIAPELSAKEAAEWCGQSADTTPAAWLSTKLSAVTGSALVSSSVAVLRWVQRLWENPENRASLLKHHDTDFLHGSVLQRLDEICEEDLCKSPEETLAQATERQVKEQWDGPDELTQPVFSNLPEGVTELTRFTALYSEGRAMRHCVASYARQVADRSCTILSLRVGKHRSTVELRNGDVRQHKGPANREPSEECRELLLEVLKGIKSGAFQRDADTRKRVPR